MKLEQLSEWPSDKNIKRLLYFCIILYFIHFPFLVYFSIISNYPVDPAGSQITFSGAIIKSHLKGMSTEEINYYRIYQLLDCIYAFFFGLLFFSLSLYLARKFDEVSTWKKSGYLMSIFGIIDGCCDITVNSIILMMLTDPQGFPDEWAIIHSYLTVITITLMLIIYVWIIVADIKLFRKKLHTFSSFLGVFASVHLHMWVIYYIFIVNI